MATGNYLLTSELIHRSVTFGLFPIFGIQEYLLFSTSFHPSENIFFLTKIM
jgi:hypothetical protein